MRKRVVELIHALDRLHLFEEMPEHLGGLGIPPGRVHTSEVEERPRGSIEGVTEDEVFLTDSDGISRSASR